MDLKNLKSVFIIAEIGQNHSGSIQRAKEVIKKSSTLIQINLPRTPKLIINFPLDDP